MGHATTIPIEFAVIVVIEALLFWWLGWRDQLRHCLHDAIRINLFTFGLSLWDAFERVSIYSNIIWALQHFDVPDPMPLLEFSGLLLGTLLFLIVVEGVVLEFIRERNSRLKAMRHVVLVNIIGSIVLGIMSIFAWHLYYARLFWFLDNLS